MTGGIVNSMSGWFKTTFLFLIAIVGLALPLNAGPDTDISGVWEGSTPEGIFTVLSLPNSGTEAGYIFLMLFPGEIEKEFGFYTCDKLATLRPASGNCWIADEKFRLPGGDYYYGITTYCLENEITLQFHTDDWAALFSDYTLYKQADGIDASGVWRSVGTTNLFELVLYPLDNGEWEAIIISADDEFYDLTGLEQDDLMYRGREAPDDEGVVAEAFPWWESGSEWMEVTVILEDYDTLHIGMMDDPEMGAIVIEFERIY